MFDDSTSAEVAGTYVCTQLSAMTYQLRGISSHRVLTVSLVCHFRAGRSMLPAEHESNLKSVPIAV